MACYFGIWTSKELGLMPLFLADLYKVSVGTGVNPNGMPCSLQIFTGPTQNGVKILAAVYKIKDEVYQVIAKVVKNSYDRELETVRKQSVMTEWEEFDFTKLDNIGQKEEGLQVRGLSIDPDTEVWEGVLTTIGRVEAEFIAG